MADDLRDEIALVGIGLRVPGASSPDAFFSNLARGVDSVRAIPSERALLRRAAHAKDRVERIPDHGGFIEGAERFDAQFFGFSRKEALATDPQHRIMLQVAWEALEDAAIDPRSLRGRRVAIYTGVLGNDYHDLLLDDPRRFDLYGYVNTAFSALAGRVAYALDTRGEAVSVDTACSSSLVATHLAVSALRRGDAELALVGGANLLLAPEFSQAFTRAGMLAPDGRCKAFDARGDGFVRSDGVICAVLMPLARAVEAGHPVYAIVRGTAVNHDGGTGHYKTPNVEGQTALLRELYAKLALDPRDTQYVEAHGTGTRAGDPVEAEAIANVLCADRDPADPLWLGSVKTNIGHCEGAAGLAGLVKVALSLKHRTLPRSLHFEEPNPKIAWDRLPLRVVRETMAWPSREGRAARAGVSAFGLTGVNGHVLLEGWDSAGPGLAMRPRTRIWTLSDPSDAGLRANVRAQLDGLGPDADVDRVTYTAAARRAHFEHRAAFVGETFEELRESARAWLDRAVPGDAAHASGAGLRVAFVFPGQGSQWTGMARERLDRDDAFTRALREADAAIAREAGFSVLDVLRDERPEALDDIAVVQPTLFAVQWALAALWRSWGVRPAAVVGHSMGETAAACVSGVLSLADGAAVICRRSRLMRALRGRGAMLLVELSPRDAEGLLRDRTSKVAIAVNNSPTSTVLSGDPDVLRAIAEELDARGVFCRPVKVDVASHSPQMDAIERSLREALADLTPREGELPLYSTVRAQFGRRPHDGPAFDATYWWENLRRPVLFADAIDALHADGIETFIEIAPHPLLCQAVQHAGRRTARTLALPSMRRGERVDAVALQGLASLYTRGAQPEWTAVLGPTAPVRLPTRVWSEETFPIADTRLHANAATARAEGAHPWLDAPWSPPGRHDEAVFRTVVSLEGSPWLGDHRVQGEAIFPAAGYVELAISALRMRFPDRARRVELTAMRFAQAHFLDADRRASLDVVLRQESHAQGSVEFYARAPGDDAPRRIAWASYALDGDERGPVRDTPAATDGTSTTALYLALRRAGLEYGATFQGLTRAGHDRDGAVVGTLAAPEGITADLERFAFHPAMLDAAFHTCFAAIDTRETHLPVSFGRVRIYGDASRAAHVRSEVRETAGGFEANVSVCADDGTVLVTVDGMRADAMQRSEAEVLREFGYELAWSRADGPGTRDAEPGAWVVFGDAAGAGRSVAARLTRAGHRVIEVTRAHRADDAFRYDARTHVARIRTDQPEHWSALLDRVHESAREGLRGVVYLWGCDEAPHDRADARELEASTLAANLPLIDLVQAAAARDLSLGRVWVVTEGAWSSPSCARMAVASSLWGLGRVFEHELVETRCTRVDLDDRGEAIVGALGEEVLHDSPERDVRLTRDGRMVARLRRVPPAEAAPARALASDTPFSVEWTPAPVLHEDALVDPGPREVCVALERALVESSVGAAPALHGAIGRVHTVGSEVSSLSVGDAVIVPVIATLRTHVTVAANEVLAVPAHLDGVDALTATGWYTLASWGLERLAAVHPRDAVLVVGDDLAACAAVVSLAGARGLRVAVATGSPGARPEGAVSLRDASWPAQVRAALGGRGVDVVIALRPSLPRELDGLLRPMARVIQLAGGAQTSHLVANVTYVRADLAAQRESGDDDLRALPGAMLRAVALGRLPKLPSVPRVEAIDALHRVHGAACVDVARGALAVTPARSVVRPDGTYVITGGAGGLGLAVASWFVSQGAREVVLVGRRAADAAMEQRIEQLATGATRVRYRACDVSDEEAVRDLVATVRGSGGRVRGVVHAAGVLADGIVLGQSSARFREVFAPKVRASWALHRAFDGGAGLDLFVVFSSAAGLLGSPGQSNYAAANTFMDGLVRARRRRGLAGQSLQWGPWAEVGLAAMQDRSERLAQRGLGAMQPAEGVRAFAAAIASRHDEVMLTRFDVQAWTRAAPAEHASPTFHALLRRSNAPPSMHPQVAPAIALRAALAACADASSAASLVETFLLATVAQVLGREAARIPTSKPLSALGVDSLMAVELRAQLEAHLGVSVSVTSLLRGPSLRDLALTLATQLTRRRASMPAPAGTPANDASLGAELRALTAPESGLGSTVFLTGATGFLGVYLVDALLRAGASRVVCLVRARNDDEAAVRLRGHLDAALLGSLAREGRVRALAGDLGAPHFGLRDAVWQSLAAEVDTVLHNGAAVNLIADYGSLRQENVLAAREALALACETRAKALHYVSTWATFGARRYAGATITEGTLAEEAPDGGYAQTKYAAEHLLAAARARGVSVTIHRPSLIGWDDATGHYNTREAFVRLLSACVATGCAPDLDAVLPITPVRYVADQIVALAACDEARDGAWHITTPSPMRFRALVDALVAQSRPIARVSWSEFRTRAARQASSTGFAAFSRMFPERLSVQGTSYLEQVLAERAAHFETHTMRALTPHIAAPEAPSAESFARLLARLERDGLLTAAR